MRAGAGCFTVAVATESAHIVRHREICVLRSVLFRCHLLSIVTSQAIGFAGSASW
jgi:hypothetical protein